MHQFGHQLNEDELHQRQVAQAGVLTGPLVVTAGVSNPTNIGAVLRIGDAMNCREVLFVDTPSVESRRVRKVSRGLSEKLPHRFISLDEFRAEKPDPLIAIELTSGSTNLYTANLPVDASFVVGNERHGIPKAMLEMCDAAVHIPMFGINSSMNVATSLGIVLYEWYRQNLS